MFKKLFFIFFLIISFNITYLFSSDLPQGEPSLEQIFNKKQLPISGTKHTISQSDMIFTDDERKIISAPLKDPEDLNKFLIDTINNKIRSANNNVVEQIWIVEKVIRSLEYFNKTLNDKQKSEVFELHIKIHQKNSADTRFNCIMLEIDEKMQTLDTKFEYEIGKSFARKKIIRKFTVLVREQFDNTTTPVIKRIFELLLQKMKALQ